VPTGEGGRRKLKRTSTQQIAYFLIQRGWDIPDDCYAPDCRSPGVQRNKKKKVGTGGGSELNPRRFQEGNLFWFETVLPGGENKNLLTRHGEAKCNLHEREGDLARRRGITLDGSEKKSTSKRKAEIK